MKTRFLLLLALLPHFVFSQSQKWKGGWTTVIYVESVPIDVRFNIQDKHSGYVTRLDVPQQGLKNFATNSTSIEHNQITIEMEDLKAVFKGKRTDSSHIQGIFTQNGKNHNLVLTRTWGIWPVPKPQTPLPPFNYFTRDFKIPSYDFRFKIAGTISAPDSVHPHPAIILISGSGAQDRDGSIGNHHPFALLADEFTKMGYTVMRCDDRGAGKTTGSPASLRNTTTADFAGDVSSFVDYLKQFPFVDSNQIGLLGHSEGGAIAPMVAAQRKDIAFLLLLAAPGISGKELNIFQNEIVLKSSGMKKRQRISYMKLHSHLMDAVDASRDTNDFKPRFDSVIRDWKQKEATYILRKKVAGNDKNIAAIYKRYEGFFIPWWKYFLALNPAENLKNVHCPVLAINGSKDNQVESKTNLPIIKNSLEKAGNKNYTITEINGLNHLFQHCKTCNLPEYFILDETFNTEALQVIKDWLQKNVPVR